MQKLGLGPSASDARGSVMFQFDNALFHFRPLRALHCWTSLHCSRWVVVWSGWICFRSQLPCLVQSSFEQSQPHIYAWDLPCIIQVQLQRRLEVLEQQLEVVESQAAPDCEVDCLNHCQKEPLLFVVLGVVQTKHLSCLEWYTLPP